MLIFLPLVVLLAALLIILFLPRFRPTFSSEWLTAVGGMMISGAIILVLRTQIPIQQTLSNWTSLPVLNISPGFLFDQTSWVFALAIIVLGISCFLLPVKQSPQVRMEIIFTLWLLFFSLICIFSANLLTITLTWIAFDLAAFSFSNLLSPIDKAQYHAKVLSSNMLAAFLLVFAIAVSGGSNPISNEVFSITLPNAVLAFTAIFIRLGSGLHDQEKKYLFSDNTYLSRLHPFLLSATTLILAARASNSDLSVEAAEGVGLLILVTCLVIVIKAYRKYSTGMHIPYWFMLAGALAILYSGLDNTISLHIWILELLYISWLSLHIDSKNMVSRIVSLVMMALVIIGNPFFIDFPSTQTSWRQSVISIGAVLVHTLLLTTFQRRAFSTKDPLTISTDRSNFAYFLGLSILPLTSIGFILDSGLQFPSAPGDLLKWSPVYIFGLIVIFTTLGRLKLNLPEIIFALFDTIFSPKWLVRLVSRIFSTVTTSINTLTALLEGEGGVLWALLLVALLVSLITQIPGGS